MKKLFCLFLLIPSLLSAQSGRNSIDGFVGPSFSHGQLSMSKNGGGYATYGHHVLTNINFFRSGSRLGYTVSIGLGTLRLNQSALKRDYQERGTDASFDKNSHWRIGQLMTGVMYGLSKGKYFADGRVLAGIYFGDAPYVFANDPSKLSLEQNLFQNETVDCFVSPGAMLMLNAGYQVSPHWSVLLGASALASKARIVVNRNERAGEYPAPAFSHSFPLTSVVSTLHVGFGWKP